MANSSHYGEPPGVEGMPRVQRRRGLQAGWLALALMLRQSDSTGVRSDREVPAIRPKQHPAWQRLRQSAGRSCRSQLLSPKADRSRRTGAITSSPPADPSPGPAAAAAPASAMTLASLPPVPVWRRRSRHPGAQPGAASAADRVAVATSICQATTRSPGDPVDARSVPLPPRPSPLRRGAIPRRGRRSPRRLPARSRRPW